MSKIQIQTIPHSLHYWSIEEEQQLLKSVEQHGTKTTRTASQCAQRYRRLIRPSKRQPWTTEEDEELLKLVKIFGVGNWAKVAKKCPNRTGKQIRERYLQILNPTIVKQRFTKRDDQKIISLVRKMGFKWRKIALEFEARSDNHVKNRFYSHIVKKIIKESPDKFKDILELLNKRDTNLPQIEQKEEKEEKKEEDVKKQIIIPQLGNKTKKITKVKTQKIKCQNKINRKQKKKTHTQSPKEQQKPSVTQNEPPVLVPYIPSQNIQSINTSLYQLQLLQNSFNQLTSQFLQPQYCYPSNIYTNYMRNQSQQQQYQLNQRKPPDVVCKEEAGINEMQQSIENNNNPNNDNNRVNQQEQQYYQQRRFLQPIIVQYVPTIFMKKF